MWSLESTSRSNLRYSRTNTAISSDPDSSRDFGTKSQAKQNIEVAPLIPIENMTVFYK